MTRLRRSIESCQYCFKRSLTTYNVNFLQYKEAVRAAVLFPGVDSEALTEIFVKAGIKNVKSLRDICSFDGKISSLAYFGSPKDADDLLRDTKSSCRTCFFGGSNRKVVQRLNSKNSQSKSFLHLPSLCKLPFSDQIVQNYVITSSSRSQTEESFFVYDQISDLISNNRLLRNSLISSDCVQLFGSAVNGFGSENSDVDMAFYLKARRDLFGVLRRFEEQMKNQKMLFESTYSILGAKVPLISFQHRFFPVYGDITPRWNNMELMQSKLSYFYSLMHPAVVQVFTAIKQLLRQFSIIASYKPGFFTSFQISVIYLFYLMQQNVIPSVECVLTQFKGKDIGDVLPSELQNIDKFSQNEQTEELFYGFFVFVAQFDFEKFKLDPFVGEKRPKSFLDANRSSSIFVLNPFDVEQNVCRAASKNKLSELKSLSAVVANRPHRTLDDYFSSPLIKKTLKSPLNSDSKNMHILKNSHINDMINARI